MDVHHGRLHRWTHMFEYNET